MPDPIAIGALALAFHDSWAKRQRDRVVSELLCRLENLESLIQSSDAPTLEEIDSLIGKVISAGLKDTRKWKLRSLANVLHNASCDDTGLEDLSACTDLIDRLDFRHAKILHFIQTGIPDDHIEHSTKHKFPDDTEFNAFSYDCIAAWNSETSTLDLKLLWPTVSDLVSWGILRTSASTEKNRHKIMIGINPTGLFACSSFSLSRMGELLINVLEIHVE